MTGGQILPIQPFKRCSIRSENLCWLPLRGEYVCSFAFVTLDMEEYFCFAQLASLAMPMPSSKKNPTTNKNLFERTSFSAYWVSVDSKANQTGIKNNYHLCKAVSRSVAYPKQETHRWSLSLKELQPDFILACCPAPLLVPFSPLEIFGWLLDLSQQLSLSWETSPPAKPPLIVMFSDRGKLVVATSRLTHAALLVCIEHPMQSFSDY